MQMSELAEHHRLVEQYPHYEEEEVLHFVQADIWGDLDDL